DALVACVAAVEGTGNDIKQQLSRLPMMPKRRASVDDLNFQDAISTAGSLRSWFGIDLFRDMPVDDQQFVKLMFNRRHLLSHTAGRVTSKYIKRTGETSVRLNQRIRIEAADVKRLIPLVRQMATNLHGDFESIK